MTTKVAIIGKDVDMSVTATIANGDTDSGAVDLTGKTLVGISFPSTLDGTSLKIKVATASGGTYNLAKNSAGDITYVVAASSYFPLDPAVTQGMRYIKLTLGSQTGATICTLHTRVA